MESQQSLGDSPTSPQTSFTKKRFWNSFRSKTSRKLTRKNKNKEQITESLSASQPNISNDDRDEFVDLSGEELLEYTSDSIEARERMVRRRLVKEQEVEESSPDRSLSDPNVSPIKQRDRQQSGQFHSDEGEREDEGDSGIAVVESTGQTEVGYLPFQ